MSEKTVTEYEHEIEETTLYRCDICGDRDIPEEDVRILTAGSKLEIFDEERGEWVEPPETVTREYTEKHEGTIKVRHAYDVRGDFCESCFENVVVEGYQADDDDDGFDGDIPDSTQKRNFFDVFADIFRDVSDKVLVPLGLISVVGMIFSAIGLLLSVLTGALGLLTGISINIPPYTTFIALGAIFLVMLTIVEGISDC